MGGGEGEGKGKGRGRGWRGAENRGLLSPGGKWAAAAERAGRFRLILGHVGSSLEGKSWGGAAL